MSIHYPKEKGISSQQQSQLDAYIGLQKDKSYIEHTVSIYSSEKKYKEEKRTEQQNKYYHQLLDIICDHTGEEHMILHEDLKIKFLARPYIKEDKEYLIVKSTRDLKPKEFGDYLEKIFKWASEELNLILPSSDQFY